MTRSLRTPGHQALMQVLVETRKSKGITQQELADRLDRPQSYIAKVETGERRLDVIEFIEWSQALATRPENVIAAISVAMST
ncbi:helix-turn-helix transcriptional regulator [uncultured Roseobacter sp.]|uniref:helix-turn-helix domain-containing protein n=1 Tax=uncultured Roseobacter sp. TaxID=114847 RepID=UPI0026282990|nr:helix-turn-helix transcriptional regulator [uncultured Roseobacter sp.]